MIIGLLRLNEPVVWISFKQDITRCCRKSRTRDSLDSVYTSDSGSVDLRKGIDDGDVFADSLNAFLTSSLNVELVYTILKGIRKIVRTPDLETWKNG